jgi:hypothetical protein
MGWATPYIEKLKLGETVSFRPRGHSMKGKIESGQLCTVKPIENIETLQKRRHCTLQGERKRIFASYQGDPRTPISNW